MKTTNQTGFKAMLEKYKKKREETKMNQQTASSQGNLKLTYKAEVAGKVGKCQHLQLDPW